MHGKNKSGIRFNLPGVTTAAEVVSGVVAKVATVGSVVSKMAVGLNLACKRFKPGTILR